MSFRKLGVHAINDEEECERMLDNGAKSKDGQAIFSREGKSYVYAVGTQVTKDQLLPHKDLPDHGTS